MKRSILLILFFISQIVVAQENVLTPEDVAKIEVITNAVISENGETIAYQKLISADPTEKNAPPETQLYVYDRADQNSTALITEYSTSNVHFRPGNGSITFTAKRENDSVAALYEIPVSGGEAQKLYEFSAAISSYNWHPNGSMLAFVANREIEEDKKDPELPYQPEIYETDLQNSAAYIVDLENPVPTAAEVEGHVTGVKWSPEGSKLAVSAAPTPLVDDFFTGQKIYIVDGNKYTVTAEVDHKAKLGSFAWSPDGNRIAFIAGEDQHDPIEGRMFIIEATGGDPQILQRDFEGMFDGIAWRDNSTIMYLASEGVHSSLGTMDLNGNMDSMFQDENINITSFSGANNIIAFTANTPQHPNELYELNSEAASADRLTTSNTWLEDEQMGEQEVITYQASDGLEIQGILIHPINRTDSIPLITVVHGGPEAHYDNGWLTTYNMPGQVGAGAGYAVFYPNYRGSTGRGLEFAKASQGDPAGKEFDDIIDGIDYLIENNDVDREKVGVTGGSYGGYATAWMATRHTERFAAGVMSVGISNNISKWGTSDIPEEMFLVHSRKRIWDDYEFYLERSPIFYADQAETPLLIMHGKEDTRVDPGQSYELYRHIKTRTDTPVRLVLYPGEGHGNRNSTARYDYNLRMMRWFDTWLKDEAEDMPKATLEVEGR